MPHTETMGMPAQHRTTTRGDAPRALSPTEQVASTWVVRPKKGIAIWVGQRRNVARQGDMPKHPKERGKTNGPPT